MHIISADTADGDIFNDIEIGTIYEDGLASLANDVTHGFGSVTAFNLSDCRQANLDGCLRLDNLIVQLIVGRDGQVGSVQLNLTRLGIFRNGNGNGVAVVSEEVLLANNHLLGKGQRVDEVQVVTLDGHDVARHG